MVIRKSAATIQTALQAGEKRSLLGKDIGGEDFDLGPPLPGILIQAGF